MNHTKLAVFLKYASYALLILLLYVLQTTPGMFAIHGITPMWVVPAAMTIAMVEGEFVGGLYGAFAGLLLDMGGVALFGFNGLFLSVCCVIAGLLVIYLLRCNLLGCLLFVAFTLVPRGSIEYLFAYGMWGHDNVWKLYVWVTIPTIIYTLAVTPLVYWLVRWMNRKFDGLIKRP